MEEEQALQEQASASEPKKPWMHNKKEGLVALVILVVILVLAIGYFVLQNPKSAVPIIQNATTTPTSEVANSSTTVEVSNTTVPTSTPPDINPYPEFSCTNTLSAITSASGAVAWQNVKALPDLKLFDSRDDRSKYSRYYKVGTFNEGPYQGGDFIIVVAPPAEMGPTAYYRLAGLQGKYTYLSKLSDSLPTVDSEYTFKPKFTVDTTYTLEDLQFPKALHSNTPQADYTFVSQVGFFCADHYRKVFTDASLGDVYTNLLPGSAGSDNFGAQGFYVKSPDDTLVTYQLVIPFTEANNIPLVTWNNGQKNKNEYAFQHIGGCGAGNYRDVANIGISDLIQVGTTLNGQAVYGYKNTKIDDLQTTYDGMYVPEGEIKISYATFLADHPIFFWQDPFGEFVRFHNNKFQPMAECGKPVIYLYPQKTEHVHVTIAPQGGLSYSEPIYTGSWNVIATKEGALTNISDGKTYPYLFWEGRGGLYETPGRGFVVAQSDVHNFLTEKLAQLGLHVSEAKDFMDFWEPRMQNSPYYFITFMDNQTMDILAPLTVTPKPDTVIRILMDFKPLTEPIPVQGYKIHTPERNGFTVVEWGGVNRGD